MKMAKKAKREQPDQDHKPTSIEAMAFWSRLKHPSSVRPFSFRDMIFDADESDGKPSPFESLPQVKPDANAVYSLHISLDQSSPLIWRRVQLRSISLEVLHDVIQFAIGWANAHLHMFEIRGSAVPNVEEGELIDESNITIDQLYAAKIKKFAYTYDLGDDWRHTIKIEKRIIAEPDVFYPRCMEGEEGAPIEDIGGIDRWCRYLEAVKNHGQTQHPDIADLLEWFGSDYVAEKWNSDIANKRLHLAFGKRPRRKRQS
jgi:hypothetical protein